MADLSAIGSAASAGTGAGTASSRVIIARNFDTFLQLLTTQLKNQNPLDPLDTNQFTQQLVQFAQVEQQISTNTSLNTLISLQQTAQATAALGFIGATVSVDGHTAKLADNRATWRLTAAGPGTAAVTITSRTGQTAYTGTISIAAGPQDFVWNGRGNDGTAWPAGDYSIAISARSANGQPVSVSTEVTGVVDGIDIAQSPPALSIGGQIYTLDQVRQVRRAATD
ncbi:MAG TPA: flagellar hook capping FlgD N-terminal domain-containing protein [Xanthobacteraceae bacterium]|nr:flagellar hook capping FlgD N-terminal domain-containing protein [Xanthobacteraceae bacterium]